MGQAIKSKKIAARVKKKNPGRNDEQDMKPLYEKREAGTVLKKNLRITTRREIDESRGILAAIVESSADAIISEDFNGIIKTWNSGAENIYGHNAGEVIGKSISLIMPPSHPDEYKEVLAKIARGETLKHYETQRRRKDGQIIDVSLTISPIKDASGKIISASTIASDITERKEIEAGLEKTRKELAVIKKTADEASEFAESIINTVREPLIALDHDLRVVKASRSFYEFFKVRPEETVGQLIYDLGNKQWDIPKLRELLETILPNKTTFDNYEVDHEFATIGRRIMLLNARQIKRVLGKEWIILLAIEDITERKRLENLLMESEELYKGVFKTASDGILLLEKREGMITHANPAAEKMLGYSVREFIGNELKGMGFMLDFGDFQTTIQNLNKNGIINYENVPVKTKSGQLLHTDIYLVNKTKLVQCNIRDISDRTQAEDSLRKSEKNFRRSLEDSPLGVRVATANGATIYANKAFLDIYGYESIEEFYGIPIKERYTPQSYAEFQMRKKDREQGNFGPREYEINIVRKNGAIRHLLVFRHEVLWSGTKQFQVIYQDITERKQAEEALNAISTHQEALLSSVPDFIMETDTNKVYTWANPAGLEFFGEDVIGKEASFYFYGEQNTYEVVEPLFRGDERVFYVESWQRRHDGEKRLLAWWSRVLKDGSGNVTGVVSSARDITERKQADEKIINSLAEKEVLLKEVHHRVKNNLMTIIGLINMQETKAHDKMFNPLLQELEGRVRAMALVHESLHKSEDLARIDLQNYIETMTANIRAQFVSGCDTRFSVQAAGVEVGLDIAVPCGLILNELITNAYKHAFPGGRPRFGEENCEIAVTVTQEGDVVILSVADNGVGLPANLDWEKSETVGLRLVKMLSQQIGGSLEMDRSAGTAYHLKFPKTVP